MELLGFLLGAIAIAFVIAKVIFSSKAKTPASADPPEDKGKKKKGPDSPVLDAWNEETQSWEPADEG